MNELREEIELPARPKRYSTEIGVLRNQVPGRCNTWSETTEDADGDEIDAQQFVRYADKIEAQLKSSLAANRELQECLKHYEESPFFTRCLFIDSGILSSKNYADISDEDLIEVMEYSATCKCQACAEVKHMIELRAVNREQKEKIERLNEKVANAEAFEILAQAECDSLRASAGEKPQDAWKRGQQMMLNRLLSILREGHGEDLNLALMKYVAPPTLPAEEK